MYEEYDIDAVFPSRKARSTTFEDVDALLGEGQNRRPVLLLKGRECIALMTGDAVGTSAVQSYTDAGGVHVEQTKLVSEFCDSKKQCIEGLTKSQPPKVFILSSRDRKIYLLPISVAAVQHPDAQIQAAFGSAAFGTDTLDPSERFARAIQGIAAAHEVLSGGLRDMSEAVTGMMKLRLAADFASQVDAKLAELGRSRGDLFNMLDAMDSMEEAELAKLFDAPKARRGRTREPL